MPELGGGVREFALTAAAGNAGMLNQLNPEGRDMIVWGAAVRIDHVSTGASTADVGITTTGASSDNLIDGQTLATAGTVGQKGTNGQQVMLWPAAGYLTMTQASGDVTGFVGALLVRTTIADPG